jgi:hypothetical protein
MNREVIAIDFDDVIADENDSLREYVNRLHGWKHTAEEYQTPDEYWGYWERKWPLPPAEARMVIEGWWASPEKATTPPKEGVIAAIGLLRQRYDLEIITSRDQPSVEITHAWINTHLPDSFTNVHFVPLWNSQGSATKAEICGAIGAGYLVDDSYSHCELAAQAGVQALLFGTYGWNNWQKLKPGMVRVPHWSAVLEYFDARS